MELIEKLIEGGFLDEEKASSITEEEKNEGKTKEEILLRKKIISEEELFKIKSEVTGTPLKEDISAGDVSPEVLNFISEDSAIHYKMVPVGKADGEIEIGMVYPENPRAKEALQFIFRREGFPYRIYLISLSTFHELVEKYGKDSEEKQDPLLEALTEKQVVSKEDALEIEKEAQEKNTPPEEVILEREIMPEEDLFSLKAEALGISFKKDINVEEIGEKLLKIIPEDSAKYYKMIPVGKTDGEIEIGMVYPENPRAKEALKFISRRGSFYYREILITPTKFREVMEIYENPPEKIGTPLLEALMEKQTVSKEEALAIEKEAQEKNTPPEEIILEREIMPEEDLFSLKAEALGISFKKDINVEEIGEKLLKIIPEDSAKYYKMIPVGKTDGEIEIGMVYPENPRAKEALRLAFQKSDANYKKALITPTKFREVMEIYENPPEKIGSPLLEALTEKQIVSKEDALEIEKEAQEKNTPPEEVILERGVMPEEDLFALKAEALEIPFKKDIDVEEIGEKLLKIIPEDSAKYYKMIPVSKTDGEIEIGMVYPENPRAKEALKFISHRGGFSYKEILITFSDFQKIRKRYRTPSEKIKSPVLAILVKKEIVSREDALALEREAEKRNEFAEELILRQEIVSEEDLFALKSEALGIPLRENVDPEEISPEIINIIQEDSVNHYKMIPVGKTDEEIEIGMVYPENPRAKEALKFISRQDIFSYKVYLITPTLFEKLREKYRELNKKAGNYLTEKLIEKGLLKEEQAAFIDSEAENRDKTREEIIVNQEIVSEEELFRVKSEVLEVPIKENIDSEKIDEKYLRLLPKDAAKHYKMIPIGVEEGEVEIGMVYPENERAKEALKLIFEQDDLQYKVYLISISEFEKISKSLKAFAKESSSTLTERLVEDGFLKDEQAKEIEIDAEKGEKTKEEILLEKKIISEEDLFKIKSEVSGISLRDDFDAENIPEDLLRVVPEDSANYYKMAPIDKKDGKIEIGMVYPENLRAKEALRFLSRRNNFSYSVFLISLRAFEEISKQYRTLTKEVGEALEDIGDDLVLDEEEEETKIDMDQDIGKLAEEAPIVKVVAVILRNAIEGGASDIHIEPSREKLKVRFRVDGTLYASLYLPMSVHLAVVARIKILSGLKIDEQRLPQDGRFSTKRAGKNVDFRVATFPTTLGEKVVIRVLDPSEGLKSLEELGVMGNSFKILNQAIKRPTGMTLVTGPTGSGKSTTLYAALSVLNQDMVNIVTLEDPVEYFMDGINQSQVHPEIGYVFAKGLRQILRQDPDVIMVGEVRDDETAELAIHAALTGHVVLSTLHTNDATGAIPRLIDMGIKPFLIPPAVNAIVAQRLVKKLCSKCKYQTDPSPEIANLINEELKDIPEEILKEAKIPSPLKIYDTKGCKSCSEEGVIGRMAITEVLKMTPHLGEITMQNPTTKDLASEAKKQGMITLKQDGMMKVVQGYTTIKDVLRATEEK